MRAITILGLVAGLALLVPGPLSADDKDKEKHRELFGDFGQAKLQKEAADLPLKLSEGTTYRWIIEARPHASGAEEHVSHHEGHGNWDKDKMACKHEAEAKVTKSSGEEWTIAFTFDASKCEMCKEMARKQGREAPGKLVYDVRVNGKGEFLSFERNASTSSGPGSEYEDMLRTQARQLLGSGLHEARFEPEKSYDVVWMHPDSWMKGSKGSEVARGGESSAGGESSSSSSSAPAGHESTSKAGNPYFGLRYDGRTDLDGQKSALFTIFPATGSSSSTGTSWTEGAGRESGYAGYRFDDGLLEKFGFVLPSAIVKEMHKDEAGGKEPGAVSGDMLITIRRIR